MIKEVKHVTGKAHDYIRITPTDPRFVPMISWLFQGFEDPNPHNASNRSVYIKVGKKDG